MRWLVVVLVVWTLGGGAFASEVEDLRQENTELRARVEALERENERLRGLTEPADDMATPDPPTVTTPAGTLAMPGAVPLDVESGSRAAHTLTAAEDEAGAAAITIATRFSGGIHRHVDTIELYVDATTHRLAVIDYDVTRVTTGPAQRRRRRDHERVSAALGAEVLAALASSSSVGGRVGRVRFTLGSAAHRSVRSFSRRVTADRSASTVP